MTELFWIQKPFKTLALVELYAFLRLRSEVFVVGQNCVFLDMDNKDQKAHHLLGYDKRQQLVAYARLLAPNISYNNMSIGRIVTATSARGVGIGKTLMQEAINRSYTLFGNADIQIGAQLHLKPFYAAFGFQQSSAEYIEDGIPHIEMIKPFI